jgi:hypothetical protein
VFFHVRQQKQNYDNHPDYFQRKQGEGQKDHLLEIFQRQGREQDGADDQYDFIRFHDDWCDTDTLVYFTRIRKRFFDSHEDMAAVLVSSHDLAIEMDFWRG